MSLVRTICSPCRSRPHYKGRMAQALITSPTGFARPGWQGQSRLIIIAALAMLALAPGAPAAAQDAPWRATTRDVLNGLGRCYVEPRQQQGWRLAVDHLIWETR